MAESGDEIAVEIDPIAEANAAEQKEAPVQTEAVEEQVEAIEKQPEKPAGGGYKKKLNKAEAEIARLREENERLKTTASPEKPLEKPRPENYQTWQEYEDAKDEYTLKRATSSAVDVLKKETADTEYKREMRAKVEAHDKKLEKAREIYPDFDEVTEAYDGPMTVQMQQAMLDSDLGAEISYYLASNPSEAEAMAGMTIAGMYRAMGKLEARLEAKQANAVKTTKAPQPITPVKAKASMSSGIEDDSDYESYRKARGFS